MLIALMELIEPARILYLVLGMVAFAYLAHHIQTCGLAIVNGEEFVWEGKGWAGSGL